MAVKFDPTRYSKTRRYELNNKTYRVQYTKVGLLKHSHSLKGENFWYSKTYEIKTNDGWKYLHGTGCKQSI